MRTVKGLVATGLLVSATACVDANGYPGTSYPSSYGYGYGGYYAPSYGNGYYSQPTYYQQPQTRYVPVPVAAPPQIQYVPVPATTTNVRPWVARDRNNNGVPDWKERDRNGDGIPDYQQRRRWPTG